MKLKPSVTNIKIPLENENGKIIGYIDYTYNSVVIEDANFCPQCGEKLNE